MDWIQIESWKIYSTLQKKKIGAKSLLLWCFFSFLNNCDEQLQIHQHGINNTIISSSYHQTSRVLHLHFVKPDHVPLVVFFSSNFQKVIPSFSVLLFDSGLFVRYLACSKSTLTTKRTWSQMSDMANEMTSWDWMTFYFYLSLPPHTHRLNAIAFPHLIFTSRSIL